MKRWSFFFSCSSFLFWDLYESNSFYQEFASERHTFFKPILLEIEMEVESLEMKELQRRLPDQEVNKFS